MPKNSRKPSKVLNKDKVKNNDEWEFELIDWDVDLTDWDVEVSEWIELLDWEVSVAEFPIVARLNIDGVIAR